MDVIVEIRLTSLQMKVKKKKKERKKERKKTGKKKREKERPLKLTSMHRDEKYFN